MSTIHRRQFLALTGAGAGVAALSACGGGGGTLRATWWGDPELNRRVRKALDGFQRQRHGARIHSESLPFDGYWDKLATESAGHNTPDLLMQAASYLPEYAERHALLNLAEHNVDTAHIDSGVRDFGRTGGATYAVVAATNAMGLIGNTRLLRRSGQRLPTGPWSWADLAGLARRVHGALGPRTWALQDAGGDLIMFDVFLRGRGIDLYDRSGRVAATRGQISEWLSYWDGLRHAGVVPPAAVTAQAADQLPQSPMVQGTAAMTFGWTQDIVSYASAMTDRVAVTLPPYSADRPGLWVNAASLWSGSAYGRHPADVAKLITYLVSDEHATRTLGAALGAPPSARGRELLRGRVSPAEQIGLDYMDLVAKHSRPLNRLWPKGFTDLRSEFTKVNQKVGFGQQRPEAAAAGFLDRAGRAG